jgi:hypothetical protein
MMKKHFSSKRILGKMKWKGRKKKGRGEKNGLEMVPGICGRWVVRWGSVG